MADALNEAVEVSFSPEERCRLARLASISGQTLAKYIRERVLAESSCEEQVLRFLLDEISAAAQRVNQTAAPAFSDDDSGSPAETLQEQRDRILKEVRDSLSEREIEALARILKPAFDAGLWPGADRSKPEHCP